MGYNTIPRFCTGSLDRDTGLVSRSIVSIAYPAVDPVFLIQDPFLAQAVISIIGPSDLEVFGGA